MLYFLRPKVNNIYSSEQYAKGFLANFDAKLGRLLNPEALVCWTAVTNGTDENYLKLQLAQLRTKKFRSKALDIVGRFDTSHFSEDTKRKLSKVGEKALPEREAMELSQVKTNMSTIFSTSKVCLPDGSCEGHDPGLENFMAKSMDYDLKLKIWKNWRDKVGRANRPYYIRYVELKNKLARTNGHTDMGEMWKDKYEIDTFEEDMHAVYRTMKPLYMELHAYIRRKLFNIYGPQHINLKGTLPAHLLGSMSGRFWDKLFEIAAPFPGKPAVVPSADTMKKHNYDALKMFQTGDNFYANLGMFRVPRSFWNLSMIKKPEDGRVVNCHPHAIDFRDAKDFRVKMCTTDYSFKDLQIIHHELGHIQYQQQYKKQPQVYRNGANDGFHEAIGELMALASSTPSYLSKLGLIENYVPDDEQDLNFLLSQALVTVSTLPFHLVHDQWRWNIFNGNVPVEDWNSEFWRLNKMILGVAPAVDRDDRLDLDAAAQYHVSADYDMIRYFTRTILQFQFMEALCKTSGHTGPLHRCDFSGSKAVGDQFGQMLKLGSSKPWPDVLEKLTGERKMSSRPILKFFKPLHQWLKKENAKNGDLIGWTH